MKTIEIRANESFLNEAIKVLKSLAKERSESVEIEPKEQNAKEPRSYSDDGILEIVKQRSEAIHNGTAKLLSHSEVKERIKNSILWL